MIARPIRVGIMGDFNPDYRSHHATNSALRDAADSLGRKIEMSWLPTPSLLAPDAGQVLAGYDALWASAGSPYQSMTGMLAGIRFARVRDWPFVGT